MSRFVTCPLSDVEIERLQKSARRTVTPGVRAFLSRVGFPQNVVPSMFQDDTAFASAQRHAPGDSFVFAEPAECLLAETPDGAIIEIDGQEQRILFQTFETFLEHYTSEPEDQRNLRWAVQLSFSTASERKVRASLADTLKATFTAHWEGLGVSPAGVTSFQARALAQGQPSLKRLEYPGWTTPMFFLDQRIDQPNFIAFKGHVRGWEQSGLGFKLINYGVLPADLEAEHDEDISE